jgi:hypothetical protein
MQDKPTGALPSLVTVMRAALDEASVKVAAASRNPATKAKMAQRILSSVAGGVTSPQDMIEAAVDEGREPAI